MAGLIFFKLSTAMSYHSGLIYIKLLWALYQNQADMDVFLMILTTFYNSAEILNCVPICKVCLVLYSLALILECHAGSMLIKLNLALCQYRVNYGRFLN